MESLSAIPYFLSFNIKKVFYEDHQFYISNFIKEMKIDVADILKVEHCYRIDMRPELVKMTFRNETIFGKYVVFMVKERFFIRGVHPIVHELNKMINEN